MKNNHTQGIYPNPMLRIGLTEKKSLSPTFLLAYFNNQPEAIQSVIRGKGIFSFLCPKLGRTKQKKTSKVTRVYFYIEPDGDVLAVFPDELYKPDFDAQFVCYSHVGQHSGLDLQYLQQCKLASKDQYQDLEAELHSIGYNLTVLNWF